VPYVSEDIFTGFDALIKGYKNVHVEYHEVGKARDVDLYTTTKFIRKISMGASQMAVSRYANQIQSSGNMSLFQKWSLFYSTVGYYVNHQMLYLSVWFALTSQFVLVILQAAVLGEEVATFISQRVFFAQIGYALVAPGILQLILELGLLHGLWAYFSHFFIMAVYSTFHILNVAAFWQYGLTSSAYYLGSGRGTGLEHYFMKDMYESFYKTHWRAGFAIFWMGIIVFALSQDWYVWLLMFLAPSGIWLWGAMFLNPGSLPTTVHEEQWKRLMNKDMEETKEVVRKHSRLHEYEAPIRGNGLKRSFLKTARAIKRFFLVIHWLYTLLNFAIHTRVIRLIGVCTSFWKTVFAEKIPTFIFTDERRRVVRWDEEDIRQKSIFFNSSLIPIKRVGVSEDVSEVAEDSGRGPLPAPPKGTKKASLGRKSSSSRNVSFVDTRTSK